MSEKENLPDDFENDDFVEEVDLSNIDDDFEDDDEFYGPEKSTKGKLLNIVGVICFLLAGLVGVWQFWLSGVEKYEEQAVQTPVLTTTNLTQQPVQKIVEEVPTVETSALMAAELPVTPVLDQNQQPMTDLFDPQGVEGLPEISVAMSEEAVSDAEFDAMSNTMAEASGETDVNAPQAPSESFMSGETSSEAMPSEGFMSGETSEEAMPSEDFMSDDRLLEEDSQDTVDTEMIEQDVAESVAEENIPNTSDIVEKVTEAEVPKLPAQEELQPIVKEEFVEEVTTIVPETVEYGSLTPAQILERAVVVRPRPKNVVVVKKDSSSTSSRSILVAADRSLKQGSLGDALSLYEDVLAKSPRDTSALMGKALTLQKLNRRDKAVEAYNRVLDIEPNNLNAMTNLLSLTQGNNTVASINRLKEMEAKNPNSAAIAGQLGMLYGEMKDVSNAARYFNKAQSLDPNNAVYPYNLAILSDRMGSKSKALEHYQKTLQLVSQFGGQSVVSKQVVSQRINDLTSSN